MGEAAWQWGQAASALVSWLALLLLLPLLAALKMSQRIAYLLARVLMHRPLHSHTPQATRHPALYRLPAIHAAG